MPTSSPWPLRLALALFLGAPSCFFVSSSGTGGDSGDEAPEIGGVWAFQWENLGGACSGGGDFQIVPVKFIQSGFDLQMLLDIDGNNAFDDGIFLDAVISDNGSQIIFNDEYTDDLGVVVGLAGTLDFLTFGYMAGAITRSFDGACDEDLNAVCLWTSNAPVFDLSGVWDVDTETTWVAGNCSLSTGSTSSEVWTVVDVDLGLTPGLLQFTTDGGEKFIGVLNSSQMTIGRKFIRDPEEFTWQYTSLNIDLWGGNNGVGYMYGSMSGVVKGIEDCTYGMDLDCHRR